MTKREFALLAVRLIGLYIVGMSFDSLSWLNMFFNTPKNPPIQLLPMALSPFVLQVCFGVFLWVFASALASAMTSDLHPDELISQWQPRDVTRIGLVIIGLLALLQSTNIVGRAIARTAAFWPTSSRSTLSTYTFYFLSAVPLILVGLISLFGARFLSFWVVPRELRDSVPTDEIRPHDAAE